MNFAILFGSFFSEKVRRLKIQKLKEAQRATAAAGPSQQEEKTDEDDDSEEEEKEVEQTSINVVSKVMISS